MNYKLSKDMEQNNETLQQVFSGLVVEEKK